MRYYPQRPQRVFTLGTAWYLMVLVGIVWYCEGKLHENCMVKTAQYCSKYCKVPQQVPQGTTWYRTVPFMYDRAATVLRVIHLSIWGRGHRTAGLVRQHPVPVSNNNVLGSLLHLLIVSA
jgi:hypothetical protein